MPASDYSKLVTSEHADKPKFMASLWIWLGYLEDVENLLIAINEAYDIDTAIGMQLDIIGLRVGVSRIVDFIPNGGANPILSDDDYRIVLKAKIFKNNWDGKTYSILQNWPDLFPTNPLIIQDNQDMTMNAITTGMNSQMMKDLIAHDYIIPSPMGVLINNFNATLPIFAYGIETDTFKGYGEGIWLTYS